METLVAVAQHRNQYYGKVKHQGHSGRFSPAPSSPFREINCRTFQSAPGILPNPFDFHAKRTSPSNSPKTPSSTLKPHSFDSPNRHQPASRSSPIPINAKVAVKATPFGGDLDIPSESFSFSELWAGPAYSNSPPPSSLPIPKFSMRPKRTVSLDSPASSSGIEVHPIAKSAPASPTRERNVSARELFLCADSATETLRRILNLDATDE